MERREFIAVAGRTTAGVVLGGGAFLAGCTNDAEESGPADVATTTDSTTDSTTATTTAGSTSHSRGDTRAALDGLVFRLSTRASSAPCGACRAHAAHRYFVSAEAADAGRAHPGCDCTILTQPVPGERSRQWFVGGRDVFDDRWTD